MCGREFFFALLRMVRLVLNKSYAVIAVDGRVVYQELYAFRPATFGTECDKMRLLGRNATGWEKLGRTATNYVL